MKELGKLRKTKSLIKKIHKKINAILINKSADKRLDVWMRRHDIALLKYNRIIDIAIIKKIRKKRDKELD